MRRRACEQKEHRFLGSFSIPFTTIYTNGALQPCSAFASSWHSPWPCLILGKIEGPFKVEVPLLHLGYEKPDPKRESTVYVLIPT